MSKKINILLVDDHRIIINGIKTMLDDIDAFQVIGEASNGQEAIQFVQEHPDVNVILMDIRMPIKNGIDATREITELNSAVRVMALTMFEDDEFISNMLKAGASGYVLKHTSKMELIQAIHKVSEGEPFFSHDIAKIVMSRFTNNAKPAETNPMSIRTSSASSNGQIELTERELEILRLIASQLTNQEIADKLYISPRTVHSHRRNLMQKVGVKNTAGLVRYAMENSLI